MLFSCCRCLGHAKESERKSPKLNVILILDSCYQNRCPISRFPLTSLSYNFNSRMYDFPLLYTLVKIVTTNRTVILHSGETDCNKYLTENQQVLPLHAY